MAVVRGRDWCYASFYAARQSSYRLPRSHRTLFVWTRWGMKRADNRRKSRKQRERQTGTYQNMERERNRTTNCTEREHKPQYAYSAQQPQPNPLCKTIFLPSSRTIRSNNKQAPRTKISNSQELAVRLWLNRGKQVERRESRETETACTGPEQILLLP